jgi:hypothetical protein
MSMQNPLTDEQRERIRAEAKPKAIQVAKEAGVDWNSLPLSETEPRIVTQANKMHKK